MLFELFEKAIVENNTVWTKSLIRLQVELAYAIHNAITEEEYNVLVALLTPAA